MNSVWRLVRCSHCQARWSFIQLKRQISNGLQITPVGVYGRHTNIMCNSSSPIDESVQLIKDTRQLHRKQSEINCSYVPLEGSDIRLLAVKSHWISALTQHGIPEPYWSVKWITEHVQKNNQSDSSLRAGQLSWQQLKDINSMMTQRLHRVPVQYIIGEWDFRHVTLSVRPPVFIPSSETEELVGLAIASFDQSDRSFKFLDFCCGSGAIAVSLLYECPKATGVAMDMSRDAVLLTQENATRNGVEQRLHILHCSVAESLQLLADHRLTFDLIISNPPYIASERVPLVQEEVHRYVDHKALDGGADGLSVVTEILSVSKHLLTPRGQVWLETDVGQTDGIHRLVSSSQNHWGLVYHSTHCDLTHTYRFHKLVRRE